MINVLSEVVFRLRARGGAVVALVALSLMASSWLPPITSAQSVSNRTLGIRWQSQVPHLYFSARDVATRSVRDKLQSGLPQTINTQIFAFEAGKKKPVAAYARTCRIVFDLWEEAYRIHLEESGKPRSIAVRSLEQALSSCVVVRATAVGRERDYSPLRGRHIYFAVLVEFNPVSDATVKRIRRWLSRPAGTSAGNEAFFGSFVSLFVNNRIGAAEHVLRFRSQRIPVPP